MFGKNFRYSFGVTWSSSQKKMLSAASSAPRMMTRTRLPGVGAASACKTNASGASPILPLMKTPSSADTRQGSSAAYCIEPTSTTSSVKIVAASGVPKMAENAPAMPHIVIKRQSRFSKCSALPSCPDTLPPSSRAAPSRPLDPPNRCVATVEKKMSGAVRSVSGLCSRTDTKIWFVEPPPSGSKR